jgi:hypothetical protein
MTSALSCGAPNRLTTCCVIRADIVSRFWTRETAETFCTGALLPGVAAPRPNWLRVADQILLSPLGVDGLDEQLAEALGSDPATAADRYGQLADTLATDGFISHAHVLRRKQLDALAAAGKVDAVAALAAQLGAIALHEGDMHQAQLLNQRLAALVHGEPLRAMGNAAESTDTIVPDATEELSIAASHHAELISAALYAAEHPLGDSSALALVLRNPPAGLTAAAYQPVLVLLLAELAVADATVTPGNGPAVTQSAGAASVAARLAELDDLISSALTQLADGPSAILDKDAAACCAPALTPTSAATW